MKSLEFGPLGLVTATKVSNTTYRVIYYNGVDIGDIEMDVDGYYKYWPMLRGGYWEAEPMREIAYILDQLNEDWDTQIRNELRRGGTDEST